MHCYCLMPRSRGLSHSAGQSACPDAFKSRSHHSSFEAPPRLCHCARVGPPCLGATGIEAALNPAYVTGVTRGRYTESRLNWQQQATARNRSDGDEVSRHRYLTVLGAATELAGCCTTRTKGSNDRKLKRYPDPDGTANHWLFGHARLAWC